MTDMTYPYDPDLPYVVENWGCLDARFRTREAAEVFMASEYRPTHNPKLIDTTPKPRVPDDARYITWHSVVRGRFFAESDMEGGWNCGSGSYDLEDLPGVTPETVFTVLEERKS